MPASSKQQQKFMGIVHAIQKGDIPASDASPEAQKVAQDMKPSDVKDFASTSHKGLPRKVKQEILKKLKEYAMSLPGHHAKPAAPMDSLRSDDEMDVSENIITEKQFKGLEGISTNTPLTKITNDQKLKIIKSAGNIIDFIVPKGVNRNFWQVIGTGKIKKNSSGEHYLEGKMINSPMFKSIDDLIKGVNWDSMENRRRFNESLKEDRVPQNFSMGTTVRDYHTKLATTPREDFDDTNFRKDNSGQPDLKENGDKLEMLKLFNKALKMMPGSPKQKEVIKQLNVIRTRNGLKPLDEKQVVNKLAEYASKMDLSYIQNKDAKVDGTPEDKDAIDKKIESIKEESYKVAGRPVTLIKGKKSDATDWKVKFENGKETSLSDVLALIKPFPKGVHWRYKNLESVNELMMPRDVDSKMKELGISKIPISSQGEKILKGMVKEKFLDNVTNKERLVYFVESLGKEKFGYGSKGKPLSPLVDRFWNDITTEAIFFGGKMAAYSVAMNIKDMKRNGEEMDSPYEMLKEYFKNFGMDYSRSRVFDSATRNLEEWMKRNKIQESVNEELSFNEKQMVIGIIEILKQVDDRKNRMKIALNMLKKFKDEGIVFDYQKFVDALKEYSMGSYEYDKGNRELGEAMIWQAKDMIYKIIPRGTFARYANEPKKNREFVDSIIRDLTSVLNRFYKQNDINLILK